VEVFLMDEAVQWARGVKAAGESLLDYMDMLDTSKLPILVCQSCAEKRLISKDDLIGGTAMVTMPTLVEKIASPDYKVLNF
jgi:sulfur relay (sulfurtransferase) complex TusBCD TusD component (DsrE family)